MEWVETTGKTLTDAKDRALDQLGVASDEAEFEILEEPRAGLFGRTRGEARVRARVKPTAVRPKQDRRNRGRNRAGNAGKPRSRGSGSSTGREPGSDDTATGDSTVASEAGTASDSPGSRTRERQADDRGAGSGGRAPRPRRSKQPKEQGSMDEEQTGSNVSPQEVGDAAAAFMTGLADTFGTSTTVEIEIDDTDIDVRVAGSELGLLVGPGGRTLMAVQDLARVASQRRLGDHDTRLRVDVGGYREKRRAALEKFAAAVAKQVVESGTAKALEPMTSADRKVVHDAVIELEGVTSRSEGDEPMRRVVISPE